MMPWKRWEFVRISLLQTDVVAGDPEANRERMGEWIRKTVQKERPDVVVLPEMWNMGFLFSRLEKAADRGELPRWLSRVAAEHGIYLVAGSIAEEEAGGFYNASYMFDPDGRQIGHYRKIHLFRLLKEERYLKSGDQRCLFRIGDVTAGTIICYDLRFPELVRTLVLDGAQILFVPAGWPRPRIRHWRILNQARAVENQMFVVAVNRVGDEEGTLYGGHSMVVDPWGEILVEGAGEETVLTVEIDPSAALHVRKTIPVFEDRRPEMYGRV
jgi:predicted amidohydrolase